MIPLEIQLSMVVGLHLAAAQGDRRIDPVLHLHRLALV